MACVKMLQGQGQQRGCRWVAIALCMTWLLAAPAAGYVLEGPHILDLMVKKLAGPQTLIVDQQVVIEDPEVSVEPVELSETLQFSFPDHFRSDIRRESTHRIFVQSRQRNLVIVDGTIVGDKGGHFDIYKDLLLHNNRLALHKALSIHGVDVGITSLGQMGDRIVYVIGATYPDASVSQVWVDKERLIPLRWINVFPAASGATEPERLEFVYRNWQNVDGIWYPMQIETFHNQLSVRQIRVTKVQANAVIAAEQLDIEHLRTIYKEQVTTPEDETTDTDADTDADTDMDEVQRTIEDFRKKFEP